MILKMSEWISDHKDMQGNLIICVEITNSCLTHAWFACTLYADIMPIINASPIQPEMRLSKLSLWWSSVEQGPTAHCMLSKSNNYQISPLQLSPFCLTGAFELRLDV